MSWKKILIVFSVLSLAATGVGGALAVPAVAAPASTGTLVDGSVPSPAIGEAIEYSAYLPAGYDSGTQRYPTVYLLHGRGDTRSGWTRVVADLDAMIADGTIPPVVAIMPDAPWSGGGSYYTDSQYTGSAAPGAGRAVETGFTRDLVAAIDARYRTIPERDSRIVAGYSMGGAGAVRFTTAHQNLFSGAIALSPAVYVPSTPVDSSTREFGAYGVGDRLYVEERYQELAYPAGFAALDPALPVHLFIAVGDDEYANPKPGDAIHDLDYEAATLYNRAKRVRGMTAELRVYNGGHDWGVWQRGFREGMADFASYLSTGPRAPFTGTQVGSEGDDRAGGVVGFPDGSVVQAVGIAADIPGHTALGGLDIVVRKTAADGVVSWSTAIASAANERSYGLTRSGDGTIVAGFVRQEHGAAGANDDALLTKVDANGVVQWRTTAGAEGAADRLYGSTAAPDGGVFATGYTSGSFAGATNAGDKDAVIVRVGPDGAVLWSAQLGGTGEDKGFAVAARPGGGVFAAGVSGAAIPGARALGTSGGGGADAWIAAYSDTGALDWVRSLGSAGTDQAAALAAVADGVVVTGFTSGDLGATSAGENDIFAASVGSDGTLRWLTQLGTDGDDRAATVTTLTGGQVLIAGHSSGRFGDPVGGVDVMTLTLAADGTEVAREQFGTRERDGADEWDESNLFLAPGIAGTVLLQGLTYGAVDGQASAGQGDVFLVTRGGGAVPSATPSVTPPVTPGPGSTTAPALVPGTGAGPGEAAGPGGNGGVLGVTGIAAARLLAIAALLGAAGWAVRRRTRGSELTVVAPLS